MEKDHSGLFIVAIVGIVAVVGVLSLIMTSMPQGHGSYEVSEADDSVDSFGQAIVGSVGGNGKCVDEDGGRSYTLRGKAYLVDGRGKNGTIRVDACIAGPVARLIEYYCTTSGPYKYLNNETYICPAGCTNGVCNPYGKLTINSAPTGAYLYINGAAYGVTPRKDLPLAAGKYQITLKKTGYKEYSTAATIIANQTTTITAAMTSLATCTDSDGGNNLFVAGTATNGAVTQTDECTQTYENGFTVVSQCTPNEGISCYVDEAVCLTGNEQGKVGKGGSGQDSNKCQYGCANGACVASPPVICTDSDGGKNIYVKGTASGKTRYAGEVIITAEDSCFIENDGTSDEWVYESYCENNMMTQWPLKCPYMCQNGICIDPVGTCGNNLLEAGEECDGTALGPYSSCDKLISGMFGNISCTSDCKKDISGCYPNFGNGPDSELKNKQYLARGCWINSQLASTQFGLIKGNDTCGSKCDQTYFYDATDINKPDFGITNVKKTSCTDVYSGTSQNYYIQAVCCEN